MKNVTMKDLQNMSRDDLVELNHMVVDIIKTMDSQKARGKVREFSMGDVVEFKTKKGAVVKGSVVNINRKTVDVREKPGKVWRVTATLVSKV